MKESQDSEQQRWQREQEERKRQLK